MRKQRKFDRDYFIRLLADIAGRKVSFQALTEKIPIAELRSGIGDAIVFCRSQKRLMDYDALRLFSLKHNVFLTGPEQLQLNVGDFCNYACIFCVCHGKISRLPKKPDQYLSLDIIRGILDDAYRMAVERITISGRGEPFMYPYISEAITEIIKKGFYLEINTNASRTELLRKILPASGSPRISFTVNMSAASPAVFAQVHNGPPELFQEVWENIQWLSKRFRVTVTFLITRINYQEILHSVKLCRAAGVRRILFKFPYLETGEQYAQVMPAEPAVKEILRILRAIKQKASGLKLEIGIEQVLNITGAAQKSPARGKVCVNPWFYAKIMSEGRVFMCCLENKHTYRGNIREQSLQSLYFSDDFLRSALEGKKGVHKHSFMWERCCRCPHRLQELFLKKRD